MRFWVRSLPKRRRLVDEHFTDVRRFVEENDVVQQDAVMRGAAIPAQVLKQPNRIAWLEELVEKVKRQVHPQAGRV